MECRKSRFMENLNEKEEIFPCSKVGLEDNLKLPSPQTGKKRINKMRSTIILAAIILLTALAAPAGAAPFSNEEARQMLNKMARSYYESDPETYWAICSRFKNPQFKNLAEVRAWMHDRLVPSMTYIKVKATVVHGIAKITSEKLDNMVFRFDGKEGDDSRVIVATAKVDRIIEFGEDVPFEHRKIFQDAYLKIYITLVKGKLISYKSDEINLAYQFMNQQ